MVLSQKLHEAFKGTVERITGPRTVSAFKEKGVLSVSEFVTAGDNLVAKCPTWSWESGEPSKRKPYLPAEKQFLITRNVPCLRRAASVEEEYEASGGEVLLEDEENDDILEGKSAKIVLLSKFLLTWEVGRMMIFRIWQSLKKPTILRQILVVFNVTGENPRLPALFLFGDSVFDVGNNNYLPTLVKANHPPYGRDFENQIPTGRFSNGKITIDYAAESIGLTSPPAYYNLVDKKEKNILGGVNFASAGSGYHDHTAMLYHIDSLPKQLINYKDCRNELMKLVGEANALSIISEAIYLVSGGADDFLLNYYPNPVLQKLVTPDQFSDILALKFSNFIKELYALGARRIGVINLPPLGLFLLGKNLYCFDSDVQKCETNINNDAINFNRKLNLTSQYLQDMFSDLTLVVIDIYQPFYELITKPYDYGLFEGRKSCCGTGLLETSIFCNKYSIGTCDNASAYVFWDSLHPSQAACKILAKRLVGQVISFSTLFNHTVLE